MNRRISIAAFALATAGSAALSFARPGWTEVGDSPYGFSSGGQTTVGSGALTTITGSTNTPTIAVFRDIIDAYVIRITDVNTFRATLNSGIDPNASIVGAGSFSSTDSRLFLFDSSGQPLVVNDDTGVAPTTLSSTIGTPQSFAIARTGGTPTAKALLIAPQFVNGGTYILVVGSYDSFTAHTNADLTFTQTIENPGDPGVPFTGLGGAIPGAPVSDEWIGTTGATFNYTVALRGAAFAQDVPEPASLGLLGLTAGGLIRRRRK